MFPFFTQAQNDQTFDIYSKNQLNEAIMREKEAKEREKWLITQIDELRHQQSFLLENKTQKRKKFLGIF